MDIQIYVTAVEPAFIVGFSIVQIATTFLIWRLGLRLTISKTILTMSMK